LRCLFEQILLLSTPTSHFLSFLNDNLTKLHQAKYAASVKSPSKKDVSLTNVSACQRLDI
jgi:hypothetical protein